jgi:uncharacterized protein (DUF1501 family)
MVSRRQFLGLTGGAAMVGVGGAGAWRLLIEDRMTSDVGRAVSDRVLVILQLSGGNDGLDTVIPTGDGRYHDLRPTLAVADADVVALDGLSGFGLHPALAPLGPWWDKGRLAMVEGIGIPGQSRSHFSALDSWWRGTADGKPGTGWVGRWLDAVGDPSDPLRAISLAAGSPALLGEHATSTIVFDPAGFALEAPSGTDVQRLSTAFRATAAPLSSDPTMAAAQLSVPATLDSATALRPALQSRVPGSTGPAARGRQAAKAGNDHDLVSLLDVTARLIELRLGTQVIVVTVGGYDTHSSQAQAHPALLTDLATGLDRFLTQIDAQGQADDVVVITTSEFGRRAGENGSGTDHGQASVQFVAGAPVAAAQLVGSADLGRLDQGDLPIVIDTRSLYAASLDWLGGPTDDVLGGHYDRFGLLKA